jgi:Coenzyme PQQ synthesis protein D (PqqD)
MSARYARHPDVRITSLESEGVALHLGTRKYFTLSETGLALMEALSAPRSASELVELLVGKYDVTEDRAAASVNGFLDRCTGLDLVVAEEG